MLPGTGKVFGPNGIQIIIEKKNQITQLGNLQGHSFDGTRMGTNPKKAATKSVNRKDFGFGIIKRELKKEQTRFHDGQQDGLWLQWFTDGSKKSERKFTNGERDSVWTSWYENGNKKFQATYNDGKLNGSWTAWYENGIIKEKNRALCR